MRVVSLEKGCLKAEIMTQTAVWASSAGTTAKKPRSPDCGVGIEGLECGRCRSSESEVTAELASVGALEDGGSVALSEPEKSV